MPSITLSKVIDRQKTIGIPAAVLARLAGISPALYSNAVLDRSRLGGEKESELSVITWTLLWLSESMRPLCLPKNEEDLHALLDSVNERGLTPEQIKASMTELFGF